MIGFHPCSNEHNDPKRKQRNTLPQAIKCFYELFRKYGKVKKQNTKPGNTD